MRMNLGPGTSVVGSVQQRNENVLSQELKKWEKVVLSLCMVKRKLLKEYNNTNL